MLTNVPSFEHILFCEHLSPHTTFPGLQRRSSTPSQPLSIYVRVYLSCFNHGGFKHICLRMAKYIEAVQCTETEMYSALHTIPLYTCHITC